VYNNFQFVASMLFGQVR